MNLIGLAEKRLVPDSIIRLGIRYLLGRRVNQESHSASAALDGFVAELRNSPLAVETAAANDQHYEVPAGFFCHVLGPRMKYSCGLFAEPSNTLADAECQMLRLTCERAEITDGLDILELGCGWGSLSLWMAEHYPLARVTAVSNSQSQRQFIETRCRELKLENLKVITADMREFETGQQFDRVVSVEMFEHMRNYALLMERISNWLRADGKLFVHLFCHRNRPYLFETEGDANWMGRHFFTGGMMPSEELLLQFQDDLSIQQCWTVGGHHYADTCEAWLRQLDSHQDPIRRIFQADLTSAEASVQLQRWRIFFMACAELFRYRNGSEWYVAHYLFGHRSQENPAGASAQLQTTP